MNQMAEYELINFFDQGPYRVFQFKSREFDAYFEYTVHEDDFGGGKPSYEDILDVVREFYEEEVLPRISPQYGDGEGE